MECVGVAVATVTGSIENEQAASAAAAGLEVDFWGFGFAECWRSLADVKVPLGNHCEQISPIV